MIETRQVSERHGVVLDLVPDPAARVLPRHGATRRGRGNMEVIGKRNRHPSRRRAFFGPQSRRWRGPRSHRQPCQGLSFLVEVEDPNTGWRVPLAPSWVISKNYRTVARLVPDVAAKRFGIAIEMGVDDDALERQPLAPSMATSISSSTDGGRPRRWSGSGARYASGADIAMRMKKPAIASASIPAAITTAKPPLTT